MAGKILGEYVSLMGLSLISYESLSLQDRQRAGTRNNGETLEDRWESENVSIHR